MTPNSRSYINRFIQPDTVIPDLSNPQSWNRYSYVLNRPISLTDPTGHRCVGDPGECLNDDGSTGSGFTGDSDEPGAKGCKGQKECGGKNDDETFIGVFTPDELKTLGFDCGKNVADLACQLYLNPSAFNFDMHVDFADWLNNIVNPNYGTAASCITLWQGCVFQGLNYTMLPHTISNPNGGVDWNRDANWYGITLPLFHANWQAGVFNGAPAAIENFPLRGGDLGYATVYLRPYAENYGITWRGTTASYNGSEVSLPGTITFTTQQTGPTSIRTIGGFSLPNGAVVGQLIINGTLK